MNNESKLPRTDDQQSFSFWSQEEVCGRVGVQLWTALKLFEDGYLSFNPEHTEKLDDAQESELVFIGSIAATDCSPRLMDFLLNGLEKPYCYQHDRIRYDWPHNKWVAIPLPEDVVEEGYKRLKEGCSLGTPSRLESLQWDVGTDLIEHLRETEDSRGLRRLADAISDALEDAPDDNDAVVTTENELFTTPVGQTLATTKHDFSYSVKWEDVADAADVAFNVWVGSPELGWAKKAWEVLGTEGLTGYNTELERYEVMVRFLALAAIYHDFCQAAWDESSDLTHSYWAEPFNMEEFIIGQLYAALPDYEDQEASASEAVEMIAESHRREVVSALLNGFGGETGLYETLWKSKEFADDEDSEDTSSEAWDETSVNCHKGYEWIDQGCSRLG